ncbi:MAG: glycosyltransferase family 4 protein [Thermotogae bacterium]|nr:glycosyltransferase family 4 protein [Thermotogota bacterium]
MILADTLIADDRPMGIGIYTINVVRQLLRLREDMTVLTHSPELFPGARIRLAPKDTAPKYGKGAAVRRLLYIQRLTGRGILYRTYHSISLLWRGPQVITVHDIQPIILPDKYREQAYLYRFFLRPFIWKVDRIITVSERSKADIVEFFRVKPERVLVAYPSYDEELFRPMDGSEARRRLGFGRPYLLMVGARYRYKNAHVVVRALPKLPYDFIVVGASDEYAEFLRELATSLGVSERVHLRGYVPREELPLLYAGAFALVFPSRYEGFGLPVLEAMASGCPVIGTDTVVEAGGDAILYASPDDPDSWVEAVRQLETRRDEFVRRGLERVKSFSWERTAGQVNRVLSEVG